MVDAWSGYAADPLIKYPILNATAAITSQIYMVTTLERTLTFEIVDCT